MNWKLTVLGSSSALPTHSRMLSGQLLETVSSFLLFDCSEGVQFQLKKYNLKITKIDCVFITHLHGDHFFGIFGLLNSLAMLQRQKPLHVFAPKGLKSIVNQVFNLTQKDFSFQIEFIEVDTENPTIIFENKEFTIKSIPLKHSTPTTGYYVEQKQELLNLNVENINKYKVPQHWFYRIKRGEDYIDDSGYLIDNKLLTRSMKEKKSFAYITDTAFLPSLAQEIFNVSLLYHEATFAHDLTQEAEKKMHSTSEQAAQIAKLSNAKKLLLGHFSVRYSDINQIVFEAQQIFPNTLPAFDGLEINF